MTAMKNIKTSWLSREALALGVFVLLMNIVVVMYYMELPHILIFIVELLTLLVGVFGIHAQAMIYRIKARPSWNRITTNMKFFGVSYIGMFFLSFIAMMYKMDEVAIPLLALGMLGALAQMFFTYEDLRTLSDDSKDEYQLKRTKRLYDENFYKIKEFRFISLVVGGVIFPLLAIVLLSSVSAISANFIVFFTILLVFASEISDRFLFYSTVVPLGMAGGFFVGKQRY
jgi:DMSO reductase anchor subunit